MLLNEPGVTLCDKNLIMYLLISIWETVYSMRFTPFTPYNLSHFSKKRKQLALVSEVTEQNLQRDPD